MLRYLRSGLTGISEEETDCLEDYVLALGIRGHSKWTKVWTAKMQGMTDEELDRINGIRERLILSLEAFYAETLFVYAAAGHSRTAGGMDCVL